MLNALTLAVPPLSLTTFSLLDALPILSSLVMVQVTLSPRPRTTEPVCAFPLTAPAAPTQLQVPSVYVETTSSWSVLLPALRPVSVLLVYVVVAPFTEPASKVNAPAPVVMPKALTVAVPPLSLTTFLTIVSDAALSSLVMVQVTLSPRPRPTEPVCAFPLTAPAAPTQLQVPSVYVETTLPRRL